MSFDGVSCVGNSKMSVRKGILQRLSEGPVVGDGSMCFILEKRGYARPRSYTPEAVLEYPEAVLQLHREYARAGADVIQTASFAANEGSLAYLKGDTEVIHSVTKLNKTAVKLARQAAGEDGLVCASISPCPAYQANQDEIAAKKQFASQVADFANEDVDFLMAEFFHDIREVEICVKEMKNLNKPIAVSMRIGVSGDASGQTLEECAVRMAKTGADIIGTNCRFDINSSLKMMEIMKDALDEADLHPYLCCQPVGYHCPETETSTMGWRSLPEWPYGLDGRSMNRIEVHQFARAAWEIGVRYIGGCCGFEPHHIRAIAQELIPERGKVPPVQEMAAPFSGEYLEGRTEDIKDGERVSREYWYNVETGSGRPFNPALTHPIAGSETKW